MMTTAEEEPLEFEEPKEKPGTAFSVAQLLRLPNVFTAWADVLLGYWLVQPERTYGDPIVLALLIVASTGLYLSGMAWNDVFDFEVDLRERPKRPLPSGALSLAFAKRLAAGLMLAGVAAAAAAGIGPLIVAAALATAILGYDAKFKSTPAGPWTMGLCRALNVLLGVSTAWKALVDNRLGEPVVGLGIPIAGWLCLSIPIGNAIYVAGITLLSRHEAGRSPRRSLAFAAFVMAAAMGLHAFHLAHMDTLLRGIWALYAVIFGMVALRVGLAIAAPTPKRVQEAVISAILNIAFIDAMFVVAIHGQIQGLWVALLVAPSLILGRWMYGT